MYYLVELLDIPCIIVTPLLVKMLGILCINIKLYTMIGLINDLSNIFNTIDSHFQNTTQLVLSGNCAMHVTVASYNLLIANKYVT